MNPTNAQPAPRTAADTRFQKGNPGGPGNPHARACARFRKLLYECVTDDDLRTLAYDLLTLAKTGNLAALRLLFGYLIGRRAPDPDRVELDDWKLPREQVRYSHEEGEAVRDGVPVDALLGLLRATLDVACTRLAALRPAPIGPTRQRRYGKPSSAGPTTR